MCIYTTKVRKSLLCGRSTAQAVLQQNLNQIAQSQVKPSQKSLEMRSKTLGFDFTCVIEVELRVLVVAAATVCLIAALQPYRASIHDLQAKSSLKQQT
jgi:hypothetical protein